MTIFDHLEPASEAASTAGAFSWNYVKPAALECLKYAVFYSGVHLAAEYGVIRRRISASKLASLKWSERVYIGEKVCSTLNGLITGLIGTYMLFVAPGFNGEFGVFRFYPRILDMVFSSYVGYSIYDMGTMVIVGDEPMAMWFHHIVGAFGAFAMMMYRQAAFFPVTFLATELTVVPTNLVWYLRTLDVDKKSALYRWNVTIRNIVFLTARSIVAPACLSYALQQVEGASISEKISRLKAIFATLPRFLVAGTVLNVVGLGALNTFWNIMVIRNALKKSRGAKKE